MAWAVLVAAVFIGCSTLRPAQSVDAATGDSTVAADTLRPGVIDSLGRSLLGELPDSLSRLLPDSLSGLSSDSLVQADSLFAGQDSLLINALGDTIVKIREELPYDHEYTSSSLDEPIDFTARDSMIYDVIRKTLSMYTQGKVDYTNSSIEAEYMKMDFNTQEIYAAGTLDSLELEPGEKPKYKQPQFTQGEQKYSLDTVRYNFDSGKAMIWGVKTTEGEGILQGGVIKKMPDNVTHIKGGQYTTCDHDPPHYYMQMTKATMQPDKNVVFGPAYMVFEDVPFYILGLPFGFFPLQRDRASGFIIPSVGEEQARGFFLRDGGYYLTIKDYADIRATAGIYTLGSWEANLASNYNVRYKFSGGLNFSYAHDVIDENKSSNMNIQWTHRQDPKFRPNSTFSASVNYATSKYNQYNATNMNDYLKSQISSSIAYSKNWAGSPFSLSVSGSHSQQLRDSSMSMTLPSLVFNVTRINPFKRRAQVGKERWYEKIAFTYNMSATNSASFKSDQFMTQKMLDTMKTSVNHTIPVSASFNILKYLNVTPSFNYRESWIFRRIDQEWDAVAQRIVRDTSRGFYRVGGYNFAMSFGTKLFGMYEMGGGKVRIRHVMTPTASLSFTPAFGKYWETVQSDATGRTTEYSPWSGEASVPGNKSSLMLTFGIQNTLEMKVKSDKDTSGYRKIKLLEAFNINSSYNFSADSLNLAPFSVSLRTTLFKGFSLNLSATFDPYVVASYDGRNYRRINRFAVQDGYLARLTSTGYSFSYTFSSKTKPGINNNNAPASNNPDNSTQSSATQAAASAFFNPTRNEQANAMAYAQTLANQYYDFAIPWSLSFSYSFSYSKPLNTVTRTNTVTFGASVNLTDKWALETGAGYDFSTGKFTPGTIMIRRDMHCFQATFSWVPIGFRQSWNFSLRAKSSILSDFLKYEKTNSFYDNYYY